MNDIERECECGRFHSWGIVRISDQNTPLYGPRPIDGCDNFRPKLEPVPAGVDAQALWQQTGDLNPQATLATRLVVSRLRALAERKSGMAAVAAQWPEFVGFLVSQITDMRGVLVRDETKFAHLVSHTDEIVEAMRGVTQLSERLEVIGHRLGQIDERIEALHEERKLKYSAEVEAYSHFGLIETDQVWDPNTAIGTERVIPLREFERWLAESQAALTDEPVEPEYRDPDEDA